ncbi:MAG: lysophospholipase, partial [Pseudomonadota bacterium]
QPLLVEKLSVWSSTPNRVPPKARILMIHGVSEHSGRHLGTEQALMNAGYAVVRFDLRGAGRSGGRRQWVRHFDDYVDDVSTVYRWICRELPPVPLFLFGHSLGGAIAISFLDSYQKAFEGCVLSAPAYQLGGAISPLVIMIGRQLVKFLPTLRIPASSDKAAISKDPLAVKAFLEDPLCCHTTTLNQGKAILDQLPKLPLIASKLTLPTLFLHGSLDQLIRLEGSFELMQKFQSKDKTLNIIPGAFHEPHNDYEKEDFFNLLILWLDRQMALHPTVE